MMETSGEYISYYGSLTLEGINMNLKLTTRSIRLLEAFQQYASSIPLNVAYNYVKEHQEMDNDLGKYEFVILQLMKALGYDNNAVLRDINTAKRLRDLNDNEIWQALTIASRVHAGVNCGIPNPHPDTEKPYGKHSLYDSNTLKIVEGYRNSQLMITLGDGKFKETNTPEV